MECTEFICNTEKNHFIEDRLIRSITFQKITAIVKRVKHIVCYNIYSMYINEIILYLKKI